MRHCRTGGGVGGGRGTVPGRSRRVKYVPSAAGRRSRRERAFRYPPPPPCAHPLVSALAARLPRGGVCTPHPPRCALAAMDSPVAVLAVVAVSATWCPPPPPLSPPTFAAAHEGGSLTRQGRQRLSWIRGFARPRQRATDKGEERAVEPAPAAAPQISPSPRCAPTPARTEPSRPRRVAVSHLHPAPPAGSTLHPGFRPPRRSTPVGLSGQVGAWQPCNRGLQKRGRRSGSAARAAAVAPAARVRPRRGAPRAGGQHMGRITPLTRSTACWCCPRASTDASGSFHPCADRGGGATGWRPMGCRRLGRAHPPPARAGCILPLQTVPGHETGWWATNKGTPQRSPFYGGSSWGGRMVVGRPAGHHSPPPHPRQGPGAVRASRLSAA